MNDKNWKLRVVSPIDKLIFINYQLRVFDKTSMDEKYVSKNRNNSIMYSTLYQTYNWVLRICSQYEIIDPSVSTPKFVPIKLGIPETFSGNGLEEFVWNSVFSLYENNSLHVYHISVKRK